MGCHIMKGVSKRCIARLLLTQDLVLASTQVEEREMDTAKNPSRTTVIQKKINNTRPQYQTFTSCHFEHVRTLNIYIHKHYNVI